MRSGNAAIKKVLVVMVLFLLLTAPQIGARGVKEPVPHDEFLYVYFSHVLERFKYSILYSYEDNSYGLKLANMTREELSQIVRESEAYRSRGIHVKVLQVLPPFYNFSTGLITLDSLLLSYYSSNESPILAAGIVDQANELEAYLDQIDSITLWNGTKRLKFDTSSVRMELENVKEMVSKEELEHISALNLSIYVSDRSPIADQNVTIFGTAPNDGNVSLVIKGSNWLKVIQLPVRNHFFKTIYRFTWPGVYYVKAIQGNETTEWVRLNVRRVPTFFLILSPTSSVINSTLNVEVALVDTYSRPLPGREVAVNGTLITTDSLGRIDIRLFSSVEKTFLLKLDFAGDGLYSGTSKTIRVRFTRIPTEITLVAPSNSQVGKPVEIKGFFNIPINTTVGVYVNGNYNSSVRVTDGRFNFTLIPQNVGTIQVYALFNGSEKYLPAKSNVVFIGIVPGENKTARYAGIALVLLILALLYTLHSRGFFRNEPSQIPKTTTSPSATSMRGRPKEVQVPGDVRGAYRFLRERLWEGMHVPLSLTPREVLRLLEWWRGHGELSAITGFHERVVYAGETPLREKLEEYLQRVKKVLRMITGV